MKQDSLQGLPIVYDVPSNVNVALLHFLKTFGANGRGRAPEAGSLVRPSDPLFASLSSLSITSYIIQIISKLSELHSERKCNAKINSTSINFIFKKKLLLSNKIFFTITYSRYTLSLKCDIILNRHLTKDMTCRDRIDGVIFNLKSRPEVAYLCTIDAVAGDSITRSGASAR